MTTNAETRYAIDPATTKGLDTQGLRDHFHVGGLFAEGEIKLVYSHYDRLILGSAVPVSGPLGARPRAGDGDGHDPRTPRDGHPEHR